MRRILTFCVLSAAGLAVHCAAADVPRCALTETRGRWLLSGRWERRAARQDDREGAVPADGWGEGTIPSAWDNRKDGERIWYRRDFTMPKETEGRRVVLTFMTLQTRAVVYVDGRRAAEVAFPGGEADITGFVKPGARQTLAFDVTAYPLDPETLSFNAPDRADRRKSEVKFKGVTGDVYLDAMPKGARVVDGTVECDVKGGKANFVADCAGLEGAATLAAFVYDTSDAAKTAGLGACFKSEKGGLRCDADGRLSFTADWRGAKTWDVHTPQNRYVCALELRDAEGRLLDAALPFSFGFRDVKIKGRDLLLNGTPIHLRALVSKNMTGGDDVSCRKASLEACRRMQADGFNFSIAKNYGFAPGDVSNMDALLDACDETGMLFSFSLPHVNNVGMDMDKPENAARYRELARWCIRRARNHPSVITWAMNHNCAGYTGDMNPLRIDGRYELDPAGEAEAPWVFRNRRNAHAAWEIAKSLDATRPVYHHESGNLDDFHTVNIYLDWAPMQERSDWLQHWSEEGAKPLFFVEWGMPHISSWSSYRGPLFIWRKPGYMSLWASEYAAAYLGDSAYLGDEPATRRALELEEKLWARRRPFRWYELNPALHAMDRRYTGVQALFMSDNWRSHRAWGITAMLPWDQENIRRGGDWTSGKGERADYPRSAVGETLARWNMDDCAFIGGDDVFTDKRHHFRPGETVRKTLVILNDRRVDQTVEWTCELRGGRGRKGEPLRGKVSVPAGTRRDVPVSFALPDRAGKYDLSAEFRFEGGVVQKDLLSVETYTPAAVDEKSRTPLLYDSKGLTAKEFARLGMAARQIGREELEKIAPTLEPETPVVVGRECLTKELLDDVLVPFARGRRGRVLVFEQTKETLESLGFRAQSYGLRRVFPRFRDDELKTALDDAMLRDWNGESTLVPPYFDGIPRNEVTYSRDTWAGYSNPRVWRCRNRGAVATAIPEKPTLGDWRALVDGGFDLQYAPLLDWTIADGRITFCQLDVTARTVADPVADDLVRRLVSRLGDGRRIWPKSPRAFGQRAWIAMRDVPCGLKQDMDEKDTGLYGVYVVSSGAEKPADFFDRIANGGRALCLGLTCDEVAKWSPVPLAMAHTNGCIASRIERPHWVLNGLSNADWSWHGTMEFDAFTDPSEDGNEAMRTVRHGKGMIVFWQVPPWTIDDVAKPYLRTTKRRAQYMLCRILSNIECRFDYGVIRYADVPVPEDDPYRYYRW